MPQATLRIYPEIGHCPNWECPDEVARDVVTFLREGRARTLRSAGRHLADIQD